MNSPLKEIVLLLFGQTKFSLLRSYFGEKPPDSEYVAFYVTKPMSPDGENSLPGMTVVLRDDSLNDLAIATAMYFQRSMGQRAGEVTLDLSQTIQGNTIAIQERKQGTLADFKPPQTN